MKRPYEVYKLYKTLQKKYLKREIERYRRVCPGNCRYNEVVEFKDRGVKIPMCTLGNHEMGNGIEMDSTKLMICSQDQQARDCNAYSPLFQGAEAVMRKIKEETSDPHTKRAKYPELSLLENVMGSTLHEFRSKRPGIITKLLFWIIETLEKVIKFVN